MIRTAITASPRYRHAPWLIATATLYISACQTQPITELPADAYAIYPQVADLTLPVSCLLPGQVRKLGGEITYLTPRRPAITSARDCELRGGDYAQFDRAKYETALKVWLHEAKEGDPRAQTFVGEIYERGLGTEPDYELAGQWYRKAARQGHPRAQVHLGLLYEKGLGLEQNRLAALNWYRKAADLRQGELGYTADGEIRPETARQTSTETTGYGTDEPTPQGPKLEVYSVYNPYAEHNSDLTTFPSKISEYSIVGKATAPAGLKSVTVNDRAFMLDAYGAFRAAIPKDEVSAPVEIVATDSRGQRADIDFILTRDAFDNDGLQQAQMSFR